ncbi:hypothetical protein CEXT_78811 [Caerostris extrusa]|uniref:Uncharacterized protein n=1 Tax=Caerostris extrusa TaxID=172846 RepID=A0AAV4N560_CAEEX|nr:hypothetical protein CEXT_78811 [Caerostris extrusa]
MKLPHLITKFGKTWVPSPNTSTTIGDGRRLLSHPRVVNFIGGWIRQCKSLIVAGGDTLQIDSDLDEGDVFAETCPNRMEVGDPGGLFDK